MNRVFGALRPGASREFPPINLWTGQDGVLVTAEVPGVSLDDIDITVHQNTLTLKGKIAPEAPEDVTFHRRERSYGSFGRTVSLPYRVDPERVEASARNGILTITLPRPEADKPKRIHIKQA